MTVVKINIDKEQNMIKVYNNGKGIPVCEHKEEKMFVPTLIFGHLLTSSNCKFFFLLNLNYFNQILLN